MLVALSAKPDRKGLDVVKQFWQTQPQAADVDFEKFWRKSLHDGVIAGTRAGAEGRRRRQGAVRRPPRRKRAAATK